MVGPNVKMLWQTNIINPDLLPWANRLQERRCQTVEHLLPCPLAQDLIRLARELLPQSRQLACDFCGVVLVFTLLTVWAGSGELD